MLTFSLQPPVSSTNHPNLQIQKPHKTETPDSYPFLSRLKAFIACQQRRLSGRISVYPSRALITGPTAPKSICPV